MWSDWHRDLTRLKALNFHLLLLKALTERVSGVVRPLKNQAFSSTLHSVGTLSLLSSRFHYPPLFNVSSCVWITAMPDWKSPTEVQEDAGIFAKFMHALLGLYAYVAYPSYHCFRYLVSIAAILRYEFLLSLDFEWDILTGKKRFRWPLVKYCL